MANEKIIFIKRNFNMLALAQDDKEVQDWFGESFRGIGPYFKHKTSGSGLSFEEQRILLPEVTGVEYEDKNFRLTVTNFYHDFMTKVPKQGLKLNIALQNDSEPLGDHNRPVSIRDYLTYRHAIEHPDVALDFNTAEREYNKKFYLHDPEGVNKESIKVNDLEDKATQVYFQYKDDEIKLDQILTMLGVPVVGLKTNEKVIKFKAFAKKNEKFNEFEQQEAFNKFIKLANDKNLEYKYLIQEMIGAQYLNKVGTAIHLTESGDVLGQDMDATVMYFKNPARSKELNLLKAQYKTKLKKGDEYLPKEAKAAPVTKKDLKETE